MFKWEIKRIFSKRINVLAICAAFLLALIFGGFAVSGNRFVDAAGEVHTDFTTTRKLAANRASWTGELNEERLSEVLEANKNALQQYSTEELDQKYGITLQPIDEIRNFMISVLTPDTEYDESVLNQLTADNIRNFYQIYRDNMKKMAEAYGKTPAQKDYLENVYEKVKFPLNYTPFPSWSSMIMFVETYGILLAIIAGFICAGIFADDFQSKADAVFFAAKYGRTKAVRTKVLAGLTVATVVYIAGIAVLSLICFSVMGTSGMHTLYQMEYAYSIYVMTYGQYYLLVVLNGYIASLLAASVCMLVAAKMHTASVAIGIPFFMYCVLPFIGRAFSQYTNVSYLIPSVLVNVENSAKTPILFQIGGIVFRQIPLTMALYAAIAVALLPVVYRCYSSCGWKKKVKVAKY